MSDFKPLRSVLYMPSSNERALEKAKSLPADAIIFDLEDAVAPDSKPAAGPDVVLVPKVNSAAEVQQLVAALEAAGAPERTTLWAMVETPVAMLNALSIATASERLTGFVMGTNDLVKELYAEHVPGRQPVITGLGLALLAARAAGIVIIDGVYNDVKNLDGFLAEVEQGRQMGFDGKTLIHPGQVEGANAGFAPSEQAVADARGLIQAWEAGQGSGVVTYNGKMVESLHVESAERTLAIHDAIRALQ